MDSVKKTFGLWALILVLCGAFFYFFRGPDAPPPELGPLLGVAVVLGLVITGGLLLGRNKRWGEQLGAEGLALMNQGRFAAALEKLEAARPLLKQQGGGFIPFYLGVCHLQRWDLPAALREFDLAREIHALPEPARKSTATYIALIAALRGQGELAERWLAEAGPSQEPRPLHVLIQGILACRREEWAQARQRLEDPLTHTLAGPPRGLREALLAWSVERLTGERRYVDPTLVFGEASPEALAAAWPQLVEFLRPRPGT